MKPNLRIGTRGSKLALYQAELVKTKLEKFFPLSRIETIVIKTSGDMIRRGGFNPLETKRVFTREIEDALLRREIDLAVHSAKDTSVEFPAGLKIGAVIEREDCRDCLVSKDKKKLSQLPIGARIGTSSIRRKKLLLRWDPDLLIEDSRGNVDSRIRKLEEGQYDAIVLAYAGLKRLGLGNYVTEIFPETRFYPAPGQGAILVQSRADDREMDEMLRPLHHHPSGIRLDCERAYLKKLEGGCQLPCGIYTSAEGSVLRAFGCLLAIEGNDFVEASVEGSFLQPEKTGERLADMILQNGGQKILDQIRRDYDEKK